MAGIFFFCGGTLTPLHHVEHTKNRASPFHGFNLSGWVLSPRLQNRKFTRIRHEGNVGGGSMLFNDVVSPCDSIVSLMDE
jgi:hypothetical protein